MLESSLVNITKHDLIPSAAGILNFSNIDQ